MPLITDIPQGPLEKIDKPGYVAEDRSRFGVGHFRNGPWPDQALNPPYERPRAGAIVALFDLKAELLTRADAIRGMTK
jgi:hypothetical protein